MKKYTEYLDLAIGFFAILYFFIINNLSLLRFKYIFLLLGLALILYHFTKDKLKNHTKAYKILKGAFAVVMVIFLVVESLIVFYPKHDKSECDYIIVLGALVDKREISQSLKNRLDACISYIETIDKETYIVVSGGQGRGEEITEASAMKEYLVYKGLDKDMILEEDKSTTTRENFLFSKEIIKKHSKVDFDNLDIKIVTTDFHALRSEIISYRCGYKNTSFFTANSSYKLSILNYTREFLAIIINLIFNY